MRRADETIEYIVYQHNKACERMEEWIRNSIRDLSTNRPRLKIVAKAKTKVAGYYNHKSHSCIYPLAYALVGGAYYGKVVRHEVVHAYQWQIMPDCEQHGEFFLFLLQHVMGLPATERFHRIPVHKAKAMGQLLEVYYEANELEALTRRYVSHVDSRKTANA